jgi:predicted ATPase/DNA-binding CsgD family transcriptional regulator
MRMAYGLIRALPAEVNGFVGRQTELALLSGLISAAGLVTVTGPGGVGKTRLSLRAAARTANLFADGVCLVEQSGLSDPELLPHTVATALGLPEQNARPQLDAVLDYLRGRRLLLILDTCEHLLDACAMLADVLIHACPEIIVLATSRQPLDVPGERTYPLAPLPDSDAIELFEQRATAVVPGFAVTDANRTDVRRLCQRLDGIPLAIELATIRLRAVPLTDLVKRVEDHFRVLTGERRTALPRHQTLRVAIGWSHNLCTPAEQRLWARLSVFAGTFDIAAAEDVCAGDGLDRVEVLQALVGLVDKSVVLRVDDSAGGPYRLLDTLREFGAEQLGDATSAVRLRHVARYIAMAERFHAQLSNDQLGEYRALRQDHANIRAALDYALRLPGTDAEAVRLATSLLSYWLIAGLLREGSYWLTKVLARRPEPSPDRIRLLNARAYVSSFLGEPDTARADAEEIIATGDESQVIRGYANLHLALTMAGLLDEAAAAGEVAAAHLTRAENPRALYVFYAHMAYMHVLAGDLQACLDRCAEALALIARHVPGELWTTSYLHAIRGFALYLAGQAELSGAALRRGLAMKHELGDTLGMAFCTEELSWLAASSPSQQERAAWLLGAADALWQRTGVRLGGTDVVERIHQRTAAGLTGTLGADSYAAAFAAGQTEPLHRAVAFALSDATTPPRGAGERGPGSCATGPADLLSPREQEIAGLVTAGLSNRKIAERLVISKRTVDAHVEHIYSKLGLTSRVQLATLLGSAPDADQA